MPLYNQKDGLTLAMMMGKDCDDPAWEDLLDQMAFDEQTAIIANAFHSTQAASSLGSRGIKKHWPKSNQQTFP